MTGGCGGSRADSPAGPSGEGGGAEWRRIYDRLEALLPQVEELAAEHARLGEITRTQQKQSEVRENSLHARLLQAKASRWRWKTAYIELPLLANPKIAELQEDDLEDSRKCEALVDVDNSGPEIQLKGARRNADLSETNVGYEDIVRDLRAELAKLKQPYETEKLLSANKDKEATEAVQKLQQNIDELQVDDEIGRLRAEAVDAENKMQIFVKMRDGRTIIVKVKRSDTIYDVKAKIQYKERIPACQQRLMFGNVRLLGSKTLKDHCIPNESTLTLRLVLQGMHIFVQTLTGRTLTIEVESADTVYNVKAKSYDGIGIVPVGPRIIFACKTLEEDRTLADYDIRNNCKLYLVLRDWMRISVRTPTGRTVIDCRALVSETVGHLKEKIHAKFCIPLEQQRLSWRGELLENDCILEKKIGWYKIGPCVLLLQLRLPGGGQY